MEHSIYDFDNYRDFLNFVFKQRKSKNPNYSMRKFSKDLGFSSPNHMTDVINGTKKLGKQGMEKILEVLAFPEEERDYFNLLVEVSHCKTDVEKVKKLEHLSRLVNKNDVRVIEDKASYFLTNRMCTIISILINIYKEKFSPDPVWIMRRIRINASLLEIQSALFFMLNNGFISCENGQYQNRSLNISSPDESISGDIKKAHKGLLEESREALDLKVAMREFASITASIPLSEIPDLKDKIKKMREELSMWIFNKSKNSQDEVGGTINIQMYPVTSDHKK